jgi:hypothetical protein
MAFDVLIGGLDGESARVLESHVRRTIVDLDARDVMAIAVLPSSNANGQWDVGVRRANGWSVTWFEARVEQLAAEVTRRLETL